MSDNPPPQTPEEILHDLAWVLLALLIIEPDALAIPVPRRWLSQWRRDILGVLEHLRHNS